MASFQMPFSCQQSFTINISEDFLEYASEGSLAIEVWGNRSQGFDNTIKPNWNVDTPTKGLHERCEGNWQFTLYKVPTFRSKMDNNHVLL